MKGVVRIGAVNQQAVRGAALAPEREIAGTRRVADYSWREKSEVQKIAPVDRQTFDLTRGNSRTSDGAAGFHNRRIPKYIHLRGRGSDFKSNVERSGCAHG